MLNRVGYVTHPKSSSPPPERRRANAADGYAAAGLDADRPSLGDETAAEDDCRPGSASWMLPWRRPDKGGEHNRKGRGGGGGEQLM